MNRTGGVVIVGVLLLLLLHVAKAQQLGHADRGGLLVVAPGEDERGETRLVHHGDVMLLFQQGTIWSLR